MANGANLLDHLQEGTVEIPVNSGQSKHSLCQQYPPEQVELAFHAWNFLNHALVKEDDKKIMKRAQTPQGAIRELKGMYDPESAMQPVDDLATFMSFTIPTDKNPQQVLRDMLDTGCLLYTSPSPRDLSTSRMPSSA